MIDVLETISQAAKDKWGAFFASALNNDSYKAAMTEFQSAQNEAASPWKYSFCGEALKLNYQAPVLFHRMLHCQDLEPGVYFTICAERRCEEPV